MTKEEQYDLVLRQVQSLVAGESDAVACMANVAAVLKEAFQWWWVGFYRVVGNQLVLGPFQGPLACTRIGRGRGVCGTAWEKGHTIVVPDVEQFPGHIACSSRSRSEIVVPIIAHGKVKGVLDVDSTELHAFDATDARGLEKIAAIIDLGD